MIFWLLYVKTKPSRQPRAAFFKYHHCCQIKQPAQGFDLASSTKMLILIRELRVLICYCVLYCIIWFILFYNKYYFVLYLSISFWRFFSDNYTPTRRVIHSIWSQNHSISSQKRISCIHFAKRSLSCGNLLVMLYGCLEIANNIDLFVP